MDATVELPRPMEETLDRLDKTPELAPGTEETDGVANQQQETSYSGPSLNEPEIPAEVAGNVAEFNEKREVFMFPENIREYLSKATGKVGDEDARNGMSEREIEALVGKAKKLDVPFARVYDAFTEALDRYGSARTGENASELQKKVFDLFQEAHDFRDTSQDSEEKGADQSPKDQSENTPLSISEQEDAWNVPAADSPNKEGEGDSSSVDAQNGIAGLVGEMPGTTLSMEQNGNGQGENAGDTVELTTNMSADTENGSEKNDSDMVMNQVDKDAQDSMQRINQDLDEKHKELSAQLDAEAAAAQGRVDERFADVLEELSPGRMKELLAKVSSEDLATATAALDELDKEVRGFAEKDAEFKKIVDKMDSGKDESEEKPGGILRFFGRKRVNNEVTATQDLNRKLTEYEAKTGTKLTEDDKERESMLKRIVSNRKAKRLIGVALLVGLTAFGTYESTPHPQPELLSNPSPSVGLVEDGNPPPSDSVVVDSTPAPGVGLRPDGNVGQDQAVEASASVAAPESESPWEKFLQEKVDLDKNGGTPGDQLWSAEKKDFETAHGDDGWVNENTTLQDGEHPNQGMVVADVFEQALQQKVNEAAENGQEFNFDELNGLTNQEVAEKLGVDIDQLKAIWGTPTVEDYMKLGYQNPNSQ